MFGSCNAQEEWRLEGCSGGLHSRASDCLSNHTQAFISWNADWVAQPTNELRGSTFRGTEALGSTT